MQANYVSHCLDCLDKRWMNVSGRTQAGFAALAADFSPTAVNAVKYLQILLLLRCLTCYAYLYAFDFCLRTLFPCNTLQLITAYRK